MSGYTTPKHHWEYCDHCESEIVICGTCGNNCCNGGYGEVIGPLPDTLMTCPDCPSAYELQKQGFLTHSVKGINNG